jgi:UDPglucose--hexose-1-phosphate uridylyltransferase
VVGPLAPEVVSGSGIYRKARAGGVAKVICYSSRHDLTTSDMDPDALVQIFQAWRAETQAMAALSGIRNLLIFENKGEMVGVSNPHPHGQLYATDFTFTLNRMYMDAARRHYQETSRDLFAEIVHEEQEFGGRILAENENALAFVPFFARYAYETQIFPKRKHLTMATLSDTELQDLAEVYATVIRKMDGLFGISFPYVMTINQAPFELDYPSLYQLHWQFLPPLRQPDLKKFPAGPEIGGDTFMADTVPEEKARELQAVSVSLRQN